MIAQATMTSSPARAAVVVAAGTGTRLGGALPKQYLEHQGQPLICHSLATLLDHAERIQVQPVIGAAQEALYQGAIGALSAVDCLAAPVAGGASRQASALAGLAALEAAGFPDDGVVLIHDAARPHLSAALIDRAIAAALKFGAAVPVLPVSDTVIRADGDKVQERLPREALRLVQTPQAFRFGLILDAHRKAAKAGQEFTDDGGLAEAMGHAVHTFEGDPQARKITYRQDMNEGQMITRVGTGFDVHAFGPGDHVWLCGVKVPHDRGFIAHSDGDVALHALTDALFGAMSDGDIGRHFPPSDTKWKGAASDQFLAYAVERLRVRGGVLDHLDVTIICERPKIGPLADQMRKRVAEIAGIALDAVSVKATTTEQLGFTGRREGIAAMANATIRLPAP
jgi:2-C-methyl-D-erythritol 4-phosphate cytidylyltransferase / 2-C-methyl-D-erythritol 2,4-cyclodiphosphate synthase